MRLEKECGFTEISLANAVKLIPHNGKPDRIELILEEPNVVDGIPPFQVTAEWYVPGNFSMRAHTFKGFSWGFCGTGPAGLSEFLAMADILMSKGQIEKLRTRPSGSVVEFNLRDNHWTRLFHDGKGGRSTCQI